MQICQWGAICAETSGTAVCECPTCPAEFQPVCGDDGISYGNECKLRLEGCKHRREIRVLYQGLCSEYQSPRNEVLFNTLGFLSPTPRTHHLLDVLHRFQLTPSRIFTQTLDDSFCISPSNDTWKIARFKRMKRVRYVDGNDYLKYPVSYWVNKQIFQANPSLE